MYEWITPSLICNWRRRQGVIAATMWSNAQPEPNALFDMYCTPHSEVFNSEQVKYCCLNCHYLALFTFLSIIFFCVLNLIWWTYTWIVFIHRVFSVTRESSHSYARAQKTESILTNCAHVKYKLLMSEDIFFNNLE